MFFLRLREYENSNSPLADLPRAPHSFWHIREPMQQRGRRLRKRHLQSEVALRQTLLRLFHLVQFVKRWQFFLELNSKRW